MANAVRACHSSTKIRSVNGIIETPASLLQAAVRALAPVFKRVHISSLIVVAQTLAALFQPPVPLTDVTALATNPRGRSRARDVADPLNLNEVSHDTNN